MPVKNALTLPMIAATHSAGREPVRCAEVYGGQDFQGNWGCVEFVAVPAGSSIPVHRHDLDEEIYFIFEGEGILTVDGEEVRVGPGALAACRQGSSHGLDNTSEREIRLIVVAIPVQACVEDSITSIRQELSHAVAK
jgi:uncharacterized cupin superfamily protein